MARRLMLVVRCFVPFRVAARAFSSSQRHAKSTPRSFLLCGKTGMKGCADQVSATDVAARSLTNPMMPPFVSAPRAMMWLSNIFCISAPRFPPNFRCTARTGAWGNHRSRRTRGTRTSDLPPPEPSALLGSWPTTGRLTSSAFNSTAPGHRGRPSGSDTAMFRIVPSRSSSIPSLEALRAFAGARSADGCLQIGSTNEMLPKVVRGGQGCAQRNPCAVLRRHALWARGRLRVTGEPVSPRAACGWP